MFLADIIGYDRLKFS